MPGPPCAGSVPGTGIGLKVHVVFGVVRATLHGSRVNAGGWHRRVGGCGLSGGVGRKIASQTL